MGSCELKIEWNSKTPRFEARVLRPQRPHESNSSFSEFLVEEIYHVLRKVGFKAFEVLKKA